MRSAARQSFSKELGQEAHVHRPRSKDAKMIQEAPRDGEGASAVVSADFVGEFIGTIPLRAIVNGLLRYPSGFP
jgi:hypothetical protein